MKSLSLEKRRELGREYYRKNCEKLKAYHRAQYRKKTNWWREFNRLPHRIFNDYRKRARRKGYDFDFTLEEFLEFTARPCFFCMTTPSKGIDRANSSKGYEKENCLPCCKVCNRMKLDLTVDDFLKQCIKISSIRRPH